MSKTTEFNFTSSRKFHELLKDAINNKQKLSESYITQNWRFQFFFALHKVCFSCDVSELDKLTRQVNFFFVNFSILNTPDTCQGSDGAQFGGHSWDIYKHCDCSNDRETLHQLNYSKVDSGSRSESTPSVVNSGSHQWFIFDPNIVHR